LRPVDRAEDCKYAATVCTSTEHSEGDGAQQAAAKHIAGILVPASPDETMATIAGLLNVSMVLVVKLAATATASV